VTEVETLLSCIESAYRDARLAFSGIREENLHRRPSPTVLALSEQASHIAQCEALILLGGLLQKPPPEWGITSPLLHERYDYPPRALAHPIPDALLKLSPGEIYPEMERVHRYVMEALKGFNRQAEEVILAPWGEEWSVREYLSYAGYHVAYHIGQVYCIRHFFGEETPNN
jgi:hypothetical protein